MFRWFEDLVINCVYTVFLPTCSCLQHLILHVCGTSVAPSFICDSNPMCQSTPQSQLDSSHTIPMRREGGLGAASEATLI